MIEALTLSPDPPPEAAPVRIGGVTLAARDLPSLAAYYQSLFGLTPVADPAHPGAALFPLAAGQVLRLLPAPESRPERGDEPGLFHTAFLLPDRPALGAWLRRAAGLGVRLQGASDHGVSDALYLADPEGNGIEVYVDRPRSAWPRAPSRFGVAMVTRRLDLQALLAEAGGADLRPEETRIGHVHLRVGDVAAAEAFYAGLGLEVMQRMPRASFLASGGYHHHIAVNNWGSTGRRPEGLSGFVSVELRAEGVLEEGRMVDPSGNPVLLRRA